MPLSPKLEVQGLFFPLDDPFPTGHICSEAEAVALNTLRRENIRNGFARLMKKEGITEASPKAMALFTDFAEAYSFTRTTVPKPQDPIEQKAYSLAKEIAEAALRKGNISKDSLQPGKFDEMISHILEMKREEIFAEARLRVDEIKSLAEGMSLG